MRTTEPPRQSRNPIDRALDSRRILIVRQELVICDTLVALADPTIVTVRCGAMTDDRRAMNEEFHLLLQGRVRHTGSFLSKDVPRNGIYFFFEQGEVVPAAKGHLDRIVRIGTHRQDGRLDRRLRLHFRGNRRASVFRRHIGTALQRAGQLNQEVVDQLAAENSSRVPELEVAISNVLSTSFSFACIQVEERDDRLRLEAGLIGLLAGFPIYPPSETWLGRHASRPEIRSAGLWNTQHVAASPLSPADFERVTRACASAAATTRPR
jgi:hypothetical protein